MRFGTHESGGNESGRKESGGNTDRKFRMKITAGLGCIDEYIPYAEAGADEVFCGFVPYEWRRAAGVLSPLNRREVLNVNVQIGSESELRILKKMEEQFGVPVVITLNSPFYDPALYPEILKVIRTCVSCGFREFITADPGLLLKIRAAAAEDGCGLSGVRLRMSGEFGELNRYVLEGFREYNGDRAETGRASMPGKVRAAGDGLPRITGIIFHRKISLRDMAGLTAAFPEFDYEAFALNEMCQFSGGFCCSLHCDELPHMCLVPWKTGGITDFGGAENRKLPVGRITGSAEGTENIENPGSTGHAEYRGPAAASENGKEASAEEAEAIPHPLPGESGCGLCALYRLREAGIGRLKLVSRGEAEENTVRDIRTLKTALRILGESGDEMTYIRKMKAELFSCGCSGNCYYR